MNGKGSCDLLRVKTVVQPRLFHKVEDWREMYENKHFLTRAKGPYLPRQLSTQDPRLSARLDVRHACGEIVESVETFWLAACRIESGDGGRPGDTVGLRDI